MPAKRARTRLRWFKLWADDFLGGTSHLQDSEVGQYMRLLLAQWSSGGLGIPEGEAQDYCRGPISERVLRKFDSVRGKRLRNSRLHEEWLSAHSESERKSLARVLGRDSQDTSQEARSQKPEAKKPAPEPETSVAPKGRHSPSPPRNGSGGWPGEFAEAYYEITGGTISPGRIGKALKPVLTRLEGQAAEIESAYGYGPLDLLRLGFGAWARSDQAKLGPEHLAKCFRDYVRERI